MAKPSFLGRSQPNLQKHLETQPKKVFKSATVLPLDLFACGQQVAHSAVLWPPQLVWAGSLYRSLDPCPAHSVHNVHSVTVVLNRAYCSYTHQEIYKYKIQILFYYWIFEVLFYPKSPSWSMCLSESIVAMHSSIWPLSSMGQAPSLLSLASTHSYNQGIQFQNETVNNSSKMN